MNKLQLLCCVGVRYYLRGLDVEGHPANYVETEQIIQHDGECTSFVQVQFVLYLLKKSYPTDSNCF